MGLWPHPAVLFLCKARGIQIGWNCHFWPFPLCYFFPMKNCRRYPKLLFSYVFLRVQSYSFPWRSMQLQQKGLYFMLLGGGVIGRLRRRMGQYFLSPLHKLPNHQWSPWTCASSLMGDKGGMMAANRGKASSTCCLHGVPPPSASSKPLFSSHPILQFVGDAPFSLQPIWWWTRSARLDCRLWWP